MQAILFDLDGVFYVGDHTILGAQQTLAWVRAQKIPHLFITNTSSKPRAAIVDKLAIMGIEVTEQEILTPPIAATAWLKQHTHKPAALFVQQATVADFQGLSLLDDQIEKGAGAVVIGDLGEGWDFTTLNRAFRLLMADPQIPLVALGMTRYWQAPDGLRLDAAPFVMALALATGRDPVVLGKPDPRFFQAALDQLGVIASQTIMIGDDIRGDIGGAQAAGLKGMLVKTGKYRPEDLQGDITPDAIIDTIAALPDWWS